MIWTGVFAKLERWNCTSVTSEMEVSDEFQIFHIVQCGLTVADNMHLAAQTKVIQNANRVGGKVHAPRIIRDVGLFFEYDALH